MITCDDVGFDQVIQQDDDEDLVGIIGVSDKEGFNCGTMDNGSDFVVKGSSSVKTNIVYPRLSEVAIQDSQLSGRDVGEFNASMLDIYIYSISLGHV